MCIAAIHTCQYVQSRERRGTRTFMWLWLQRTGFVPFLGKPKGCAGGWGQWNVCPGCRAVGVGRAVLLGLGGGTRRVATALQPCHPLTGHITDTSHRALLRNATVCLSFLTRALHKHCWSPPLFWQNCCHLSHFSGLCRRS